MLAHGDFPLFLVAALVLLITPGPAVFYIVARSVQQGSLAGIVSAVGVVTGGFIHVLAGTVGLSALVLSSPIAFTTVKYFGALYLVYLGFRAFLGKDQSGDPERPVGWFDRAGAWRGAAGGVRLRRARAAADRHIGRLFAADRDGLPEHSLDCA